MTGSNTETITLTKWEARGLWLLALAMVITAFFLGAQMEAASTAENPIPVGVILGV